MTTRYAPGMSPALINLRTPITTSSSSSSSSSSSVEPSGSPSQSSLLQNPNPNPQILSSNPFFDLSAISSNTFASTKQHLHQEKIMNSVHGEIGGGAARVPRPTSGRSMPRLVKVRRHGCSSQKGRSSTSSSSATTVSSSDFNPFRPVSESLDRVDEDGVGGGMQELRDRCESWKRFSSSSTLHSAEPFNGLKTSAAAVSRNFEFGKSSGEGFAFVANSSSLSSNSGAEKEDASASMLQEEMREKLNIGSKMEFQSRKNGASSLGERASSSLNEGNEKVAFVFKSNSEANLSFGASTSAKLVDELRNLNIENPRNCDNTENANLSSKANVKKAFVFKGHNNVDSSVDRTVDSKLHDEMKNLNIGEPGNSDGLEKSEDTNFKVNQKDSFSTFVFGRRENYADLPRGSSVATLPDEMNKLNMRSSENSDGVKNTEDMNVKPNEKSSFIFGSEKYNAGEFARNDVNKLHNKMDKLHIRSNLGDSWSEISGRVEKTEEASIKVNVGKAFTFGSDKNHTGFFVGSNGNKLHSKMEELHIGSKIGDSGGFPDTTSSSSRDFLKERAVGNSNDKVFSDPTSSSNFQASTSGGNLSNSQERIVQQNEDLKPSGAFVSPAAGPTFQSVQETFEVPSVESAGNEANSLPTNTSNPFFTHYPDFRTPKHDPSCSRVSGFAGSSQMSRFSAKKGHTNKKSKNRKGKLRQPASVHHWAGQDYASKENSSLGNPESPGHYSPMDFSPYEENIAADQSSRETSVASEDVFNIDANCILKDTYPSVPVDGLDEDRASATQSLDIKEDDFKSGELNEKGFGDHFERDVSSTCSMEESFSGAEYGCFMSNTEEVANDNDAGVSASEIEIGFDPSTERQESDSRTQFCFASTSEDVSDTNFTFAASGSSQGLFSAAKRNYRRKNKTKQCYDSYSSLNVKKQFDSSCIQFFPPASTSLHFGGVETQKGDPSACHGIGKTISEAEKNAEVKKQSISQSTEIAASQEACEKWRLRGNQAYADGNLFKAEEYYTRGVNCVSPTEIAKSCPRALMLCYSNRAVVRMASGRMREALEDCRKAVGIDAEFLKVQFRAANCHLALGEVEDAIKYFKKILPSGDDICLDRKTVIEASTGLQKAQQVADYLDCCAELLCQKTSKDAENALQIIAEALLLSPYSEKLFQMKAEALLVLRKYSELIQLCEKSLDSAEKNSASQSEEGWKINGSESINISFAKLWRWCMISKSYFYLGKLEEALDFLEKLEQAVSVVQKYGSNALESSIALAVTVRELLRHKTAGNEAFQSGRHLEAVEHYTSALLCSIESRPFAAICFCNRAAAHQALGQITDAIADCSLAIALDGNYPKAISRRATLHEMIRDYGQAVSDLQKLISLLEKQTEEKVNPSGTLSRSTSSASDLKQARTRLSTLEEEARKGIPLNLYLILGVEPSGTASDIKKAYRKAALRHHPDKAGQFLARSENGDDGLWKDIAEEVHKDADRLFKMIGEAYAVLSDPSKRSRYDLEEESRNVLKKGNGCCSSGTPSEGHNYPFERSNSRHHWQDVRRSYRSHSQWSEPSRSYRYY